MCPLVLILCPKFHQSGISRWQSTRIPLDLAHTRECWQPGSMVQIPLVVEGTVANSTKNCRAKCHARHTKFHSWINSCMDIMTDLLAHGESTCAANNGLVDWRAKCNVTQAIVATCWEFNQQSTLLLIAFGYVGEVHLWLWWAQWRCRWQSDKQVKAVTTMEGDCMIDMTFAL
jgi:hypothetical protein